MFFEYHDYWKSECDPDQSLKAWNICWTNTNSYISARKIAKKESGETLKRKQYAFLLWNHKQYSAWKRSNSIEIEEIEIENVIIASERREDPETYQTHRKFLTRKRSQKQWKQTWRN